MMSLDELFEVLDCYVEESYFKTNPGTWSDKTTVIDTMPKICYNKVEFRLAKRKGERL